MNHSISNDIQSLLRLTSMEVDRLDDKLRITEDQVTYLSDKLSKVFHQLRQFNDIHGRDLHPDVLDCFNAAWRNHEASFDIWKSYQDSNPTTPFHLQPDIE